MQARDRMVEVYRATMRAAVDVPSSMTRKRQKQRHTNDRGGVNQADSAVVLKHVWRNEACKSLLGAVNPSGPERCAAHRMWRAIQCPDTVQGPLGRR